MADEQNLRQQLTDKMLEELLIHVTSWIKTLGNAGSPKNKRVNASTRVTAAKTGIDLVVKLMSTGSSYEGEKLLDQLAALDMSENTEYDEEDDDMPEDEKRGS